jgi:DNA-binding transcriptional LysR family regulator
MPAASWNDLRYLLAVSRGRTLAAAAKLLAVDDTTVARRLVALQNAMGAQLCHRLPNGKLKLTPAGETAAIRAEAIEREVGLLNSEILGIDGQISGAVRLTSVPIVVNRVLVPAAGTLLQRHPALRLELVADPRDFSLTRREADLALRLARPKTGGLRVKARCVGVLHYAVYASTSRTAREAKKMPWITYDEAMDHLPQARWVTAAIGGNDGELSQLRVHDAETALEAAIAGLGRSLLPCLVADGDARLRRIGNGSREPALSRELWLLVHSELAALGRIEAVTQWVEEVFQR